MNFIAVGALSILACIHFPQDYKETITEGKKEILVFQTADEAHLIIKTNLSAKKLPSQMAWVLPVPSLPSGYSEEDPKIFNELHQLTEENRFLNLRSRQEGIIKSAGIQVHEKQLVGDYSIEPISILADNSAREFNEWLIKNSYNPMPYENQKNYLKKGSVFLAIKLKPSGATAELKPLHIRYKGKISIPLKFTHDQRHFDADIYYFTDGALKKDPTLFRKKFPSPYFSEASFSNPTIEKAPTLMKLLRKDSGILVKIEARDLNGPGKELSKLASDPSF